jgi:hypothetical protein
MLEAARRAPPRSDHAGDDDCPLCRMTACQTPLEVITLPDGSVMEVHEVPGVPGLHDLRVQRPRGVAS